MNIIYTVVVMCLVILLVILIMACAGFRVGAAFRANMYGAIADITVQVEGMRVAQNSVVQVVSEFTDDAARHYAGDEEEADGDALPSALEAASPSVSASAAASGFAATSTPQATRSTWMTHVNMPGKNFLVFSLPQLSSVKKQPRQKPADCTRPVIGSERVSTAIRNLTETAAMRNLKENLFRHQQQRQPEGEKGEKDKQTDTPEPSSP